MQPISSEEARAAYLEEHMKHIGGVQLPLSNQSKAEESHKSRDLVRRIVIFVMHKKRKRGRNRNLIDKLWMH